MLTPVAASALATDSVDGQRDRPSGVTRFDLLKVVGSSPDFFASPDGDRSARAARRSRAVQIWLCVSCAAGMRVSRRDFYPQVGVIVLNARCRVLFVRPLNN